MILAGKRAGRSPYEATMVQELIALKTSILEGRYEDALVIVDELEGMSKQAILRNIDSYLVRLLVHLIKNQVEQRLTNSWAASIVDSIRQVQKLNLKANKTSYYIKSDEWRSHLEDAVVDAMAPASTEVAEGRYNPIQLSDMIDEAQILAIASDLLHPTYDTTARELNRALYAKLGELPGGAAWLAGSE